MCPSRVERRAKPARRPYNVSKKTENNKYDTQIGPGYLDALGARVIGSSYVDTTEDHEHDGVAAAACGTSRVRMRGVSAWRTESDSCTGARVTRPGIECSQVPRVPIGGPTSVSRTRVNNLR